MCAVMHVLRVAMYIYKRIRLLHPFLFITLFPISFSTSISSFTTSSPKPLLSSPHYPTLSPHRNIIEAASSGASYSIKMLSNITVNLIAFLAMMSFCDACLMWFGDRIGVPGLSFEVTHVYVYV